MLESTSKFKIKDIIYDRKTSHDNKSGFAVATGYWDGNPELRVACRWYEDGGMGYPQTFGKPQWMILGDTGGALVSVEVQNALDTATSAKIAIRFT